MADDTLRLLKKAVLVGNPNVGKSVIFRLLTGSYVLVSNFPGTTVEVSRGRMQLGGLNYEVVDTPGVNSLVPQSEDERVACEILLREKPDLIVQVADAKNLRRTLLITSQLVELGIPMVLVLNMIDEAEDRGIEIDAQGISRFFSIPVVETVAIYGKGKKQILNAVQNAQEPQNPLLAQPAGKRVIEGLKGLQPPALLSVEWMADNKSDLKRIIQYYLGTKSLTALNALQENPRLSGQGDCRNPKSTAGRIGCRIQKEEEKPLCGGHRQREDVVAESADLRTGFVYLE